MGSLLFSMKGRMNAADFQKGAIVLIALGVVLDLILYFNMALAPLVMLVGLVLLWPWIAIWVKRYHDSGKSGWMIAVPVLVMLALGYGASLIVNMIAPIDKSVVEAAIASGDFMEIMKSSFVAAKVQMVPKTILDIIVSLAVVFMFNSMIKSDPEENRFGPATN